MTVYTCNWCEWVWHAYGVEWSRCIACGVKFKNDMTWSHMGERAKIKAGKVVLELWRDLGGRAQMPDLRYDCDKEVRTEIFCAWRDRLLGVACKHARPFDPTLCGFAIQNETRTETGVSQIVWVLSFEWRMIKTWSDTHAPNLAMQCECGGQDGPQWDVAFDGPWPATQSDGETLLRLLGVLEP